MNVTVKTEGWMRWQEVIEFAADSNISLQEAVRRLVNSGLSHQR